ncbi:TORTIFOLIA1-like protein 4 [Magnolia sinica]|uniref:TORTIFOLIA1-like protein 4 n=1 Tax=Magnolia sinica TaxID=86752 RepID=UPI002659B2DD|nr:TORTIFOLIA1-like protein 4 [Magnolia sinica]
MAFAKRSSPSPHLNSSASTRELKQRVITCLNKLSDRDTHAIASSELHSIADTLSHDSFSPFLSCISSTDSSHKSPVRQQCVRLLTSLSTAHRDALTPLLPRMISTVIVRRLRDPDSSVRAACVDAVSSMASHITKPPFSVFLKPLSEALVLEQDYNSQIGSALCLSAAIEAAPSPDPAQLQRLLPRLVKLLKTDSFKAKPALLSLVGSIVAVGTASTAHLLGLLIPCLVEFLSSDDWAARKAAAEALTRMAHAERDLLSEFKSSCLSTFEARRFDKVKVVRDAMNQMLEAWKDIPDISDDVSAPSQSKSSSRENVSDGRFPDGSKGSNNVTTDFPYLAKKRAPLRRSPPTDGASATATSKINPLGSDKKSSPPLFRKLDQKKPSNWKIEIAVPHAPPYTAVCEDGPQNGEGRDGIGLEKGENVRSRPTKLEVKRVLFDKNCDDKTVKLGGLRSSSRVVPFQEKESSDSIVGHNNTGEELFGSHKDNDLSLIREQLVQIENQQSSLLDLLQRFIGSSQNGIRSLETRVHGIEMALDEISHDLAVSTGRMPNTDTAGNTCCKLPGAEFLSSKFWRKTEGRTPSSRFPTSGATPLAAMRSAADKEGADSDKLENRRYGLQGGFVVNPLAEIHPHSRGSSEVCSSGMPSNAIVHESDRRQALNRNNQSEISSLAGNLPANVISRSSA